MGNEASVQAQAARADELALMQALVNGDLEAIQALLKQNPSLVYSHSKAGENLWHFAAQGGHAQVLKVVAAAVEGVLAGQKKQDKLRGRINHEFNKVNQAVNQAISSAVPLPAAIAIPMSTDLGINAKTMDGITPLMAAVKSGKPEAVGELLAAGADPRRGDSSGATALHHAAWQGQGTCLWVLLQHGQQQEEQEAAGSSSWLHRLVDVTTNTGLTPLHYAAWKGRADILKQLVNAGASLAVPSASDTMDAVAANAGSTPLHLAAMKGDAAIVRLLLRANAKLIALAAAEGAAGPLASAPAASGARGDVRKTADKYGKTAANLAWDMQRSDLALILDPSTPLDQANELAAAAAKAGSSAAAPAAADAAAAKGQLPRGSSSKFLKGGRRPGDAAVDSGPSTPVAGSSAAAAFAGSAAAGLQRLGIGRSGSWKDGESGGSSSDRGGGGGGIFLPPPKGWKSQVQMGQQGRSAQQQQQQQPAHESGPAGNGSGFGLFAGATQQQHDAAESFVNNNSSRVNGNNACAGSGAVQQHDGAAFHAVLLSEPPADFVCPITNELLKDPVRACDGLAYERDAIEVWFQLGNSMMPGGRSRITSEQLTPDAQLREAITAFKAAAAAAASQ